MPSPIFSLRQPANRLPFGPVTGLLAAFALAGLSFVMPVSAQKSAPDNKPAEARKPTETKPKTASNDYLVQVGKHAMWKSQVTKMHPELAKTAKPLSKKAGTDYLVQVGKTPVLASTLRRVEGPKATRPAPHDSGCVDYLVQSGKKTVWASEIGAPCPAGPHKGEDRPMCCVVALETGKNLKPCCKEAQGIK
jgi:hypothetical protein